MGLDGSTSPAFTLAALAAAHAPDAARLHIAGQPGTFLTSLGPDVLAALYRALPATQAGFGFAALIPPGAVYGARAEGETLAGFVSAATGVGALFAEVGTRQMGTLLSPLLRCYVRHPALLLRSVQTALYPLLVRGEKHAPSAELLSIMVEPALRGQGIGAALLAALVDACRERGLAQLEVTVDAANSGAQRFYARHGFVPQREFTLYGRAMRHLCRDL